MHHPEASGPVGGFFSKPSAFWPSNSEEALISAGVGSICRGFSEFLKGRPRACTGSLFRLVASTIQTPVLRADTAGLFQTFSESLAGPMQADSEIVWRNAQVLCDRSRRFTIQINTIQEVYIGGPKCRQEPLQAGTDSGAQFIEGRCFVCPRGC